MWLPGDLEGVSVGINKAIHEKIVLENITGDTRQKEGGLNLVRTNQNNLFRSVTGQNPTTTGAGGENNRLLQFVFLIPLPINRSESFLYVFAKLGGNSWEKTATHVMRSPHTASAAL